MESRAILFLGGANFVPSTDQTLSLEVFINMLQGPIFGESFCPESLA